MTGDVQHPAYVSAHGSAPAMTMWAVPRSHPQGPLVYPYALRIPTFGTPMKRNRSVISVASLGVAGTEILEEPIDRCPELGEGRIVRIP
jgi:hypothetical protein